MLEDTKAELRLGAAENNLKRADELKKATEKQLASLQKQAEEAAKYKSISEEIRKVESGLYYLKLKEIDHEIKLENEINEEADDKVKEFNNKLEELEKAIKVELEKSNPNQEKKKYRKPLKNTRLNLELKGIDEESERITEEIDTIKNTLKVIDEDIDREKSIVIDANSNEKDLRRKKSINRNKFKIL